jgi:hypothetical protein
VASHRSPQVDEPPVGVAHAGDAFAPRLVLGLANDGYPSGAQPGERGGGGCGR